MPKHRGTHDPSPAPSWRFTKVMNMSDLSRDDDFLSHLFVEKLGTGGVPLYVHKMDSSRRLPKTDAHHILQIVRRLVVSKAPPSVAIREAVDCLFLLRPIKYYLSDYTDKQTNAFATHASRYLELYLPNGSIEIAHTSRYAHATGKSELCILATRLLAPGAVITELKGSMADLTDEEDRELKCATATGQGGIRRDFSVIHSKQLKKNHLFLGPARFVNHDCGNNVELFREGRYITFRVIKPIAVGEEVTAHYGDDYFGRNNRHCLCQTCESGGRGGYTPEEGVDPVSDSDSDSSEHSSQRPRERESTGPVNVNERRTRRGVYAVMPENQIREREQSTIPKIELDAEDSLLSLTFPSPFASDRALLESPQLSRESSATSREVSKSDVVVRTSARLRGRPLKSASLDPRSSRLATPEDRLRSSSRGRASGTEPPEQRVLRPRAPDLGSGKNPSGKGEGSAKQTNPTKKAVPKGVPTCVICKGVLPVISVDSEIVWGLEGYDEKGKKLKGKKASSLECPRCMRHRDIYNVSWPYRLASHGGTAYPTPPPVDPPVTSHPSKVLQESREASISQSVSSKAASKSRRDEKDQRPAKRQKVDVTAEALVERNRSGRLHIPSRKLREAAEEDEKPALTPQKLSQAVENGAKPKQSQREAAPQPPKKSRAERADERSKLREQMEKAQMTKSHSSTVTRKLASDASGGSEDGTVHFSASSRKRQRTEEHISVKRSCSVEAAEASKILASPAPRPSISGMRGFRKGGYSSLLGAAPNPTNLSSRRNWVPIVPDPGSPGEMIPNPPRAESSLSTTTEDSLQLITPHDSDGPNPEVDPSAEMEGLLTSRRPRAFLNRAMKPSPVNFAMRRWSSMESPRSDRSESDSQDELDDQIPRKRTPNTVDITLLSSPDNAKRSNVRYTTPEPRSYVPSRIWETGDDSRGPLESPDSSLFVLRHMATFTSSPGGGSFTDDSERIVEKLVYADSPSRDDTSDAQQTIDVTVKISVPSDNGVEGIVDSAPCIHLESEKTSLPIVTATTTFATVSAGSKVLRTGSEISR